ncbi:MAG: GGDEF domain-containing protein [Chlorobiaceae bacterium]|nr:GGDEF domain-containing protein [Chlorobiaceae bacterium]
MNKEQEPDGQATFRLTIITGVAALLLAIAGTGWFGQYQSAQLRMVTDDQALYMKLVECRSAITTINEQLQDKRIAAGRSQQLQARLRFERVRFAEIGRSGDIRQGSAVAGWLQGKTPASGSLSVEELQIMILDMDEMISRTTGRISKGSASIITNLHMYLVFMIVLLAIIVVTESRLLVSNYRHSLLPLHLLAHRLTQLNKNIPESVHDTAEAARNILTDPDPSPEIRYVTESVAGLCRDIEEKNKKLDEIYIRDEKTSLYNYRHFKEHLIIDVERAKRFGTDISLAMIDIDHFKRYNDRFGHIAGDRVLSRMAEIIKQECRITDIPSRFGGEEFAVLFPNTDRNVAMEISERLRQVISAEPFEHEHNQPGGQLTVSIGVATWPDDAGDWYSLINNADHALYEAKAGGRNKVVAYCVPLKACESE